MASVLWSDQDRQVCLAAWERGGSLANSLDKVELALIAIGRPRTRSAIMRFLWRNKAVEPNQATWTDEAAKICLSSWKAGASYGVIVQKLRVIGVIKSRNAVAGFINREFKGYRSTKTPNEKLKRIPNRNPRPKTAAEALAPALAKHIIVGVKPSKPKPQTQLQRLLAKAPVAAARPQSTIYTRDDDGCTFPIGDQPPYAYCNQQQIKGYSFCADHCKSVYRQ